MDEFGTNAMEEDDLSSAPETPEDVAVLYTWANVHGGKYRDFSASRRVYRAQQRHRMVEAQREAELQSAREREEQATRELAAARKAEADSEEHSVARAEAEENLRRAEVRAQEERQAAQRHVETAEELKLALVQAQLEMEEARRRVEEQAARYAEADARSRGQQRNVEDVPGETDDPYYYAGPLEPTAFAPGKGVRSSLPQRVSSERRIVESYYRSRGESSAEIEAARRPDPEAYGLFSSGQRTRNSSGGRPAYTESERMASRYEERPVREREFAEARPETPEDTRERNRMDEQRRGSESLQGGQFDDNDDDDYYDRSMRPGVDRPVPAPRSPADRNSASGDLHIPPRMQQARRPVESGERRVGHADTSPRGEDPAPGNTHPDLLRVRHRESAADVSPRIPLSPRTSDAPQDAFSDRGARSAKADTRDVPARRAEPAPRQRYVSDETPSFVPKLDRAAKPDRMAYEERPQERSARPVREDQGPGEARPEWLGRETQDRARSTEQDREAGGRRPQRDEFEEFLTRTEAAPRGAEDRVSRPKYDEPVADMRRDVRAGQEVDPRDIAAEIRQRRPAADGDSGEASFEERAARRREERSKRPPVGLTRETPAGRPSGDSRDSQTVRAADGGFNLRPMLDRPPADAPRASKQRDKYREESEGDRPAAESRSIAPVHETSPVRETPPLREVPQGRETSTPREPLPPLRESLPPIREPLPLVRDAMPRPSRDSGAVWAGPRSTPDSRAASDARAIADSDARAAWPRVERRRFERSSGTRGLESQFDSSREMRAAAHAAEQEEQQDRTRSQPARREVSLREDSRQQPREDSHPERQDSRDEPRRESRREAPALAAGELHGDQRTPPALSPLPPIQPPVPTPRSVAPAIDTLQQSRERVAARWFALKGLMGNEPPEASLQSRPSKETAAPMLAVVSLSGGVGKTSLVATLGRALSSVGEKVLLADTTAHGLLPYYFGARELRPDVVRTFSPPPGSTDAPVYMVNYESDRLNGDEAGQTVLVDEIARHARGTHRVLLDLNGSSAWLARRLARSSASVLVPIAPDMNSVLSIQGVERFFSGTQDRDGRTVSPYYVLNQFDASLPLHLDVREVLRQQLGDRLLPVMIRRSQSVSEALAEGMTVIDYAPESPVTEDYIHLAEWVRNLAAPAASAGLRNIRWSER